LERWVVQRTGFEPAIH